MLPVCRGPFLAGSTCSAANAAVKRLEPAQPAITAYFTGLNGAHQERQLVEMLR